MASLGINSFHVPGLCMVQMLGRPYGGSELYLIVTSEDRRKARYERRQKKRKENRRKILDSIGTAEEVFTFHDMFKYGDQCCRGVKWKQSVQTFSRHLLSRTAKNRKRVLNNYKHKRLHKFLIYERGKIRIIEAPHIDDRQIHKTLSKKVLLLLYSPRLIYDNGASLEGKGLVFSQKQFDVELRRHKKKYGFNGYIIITDCTGFFPNADREIVKAYHREIPDKKLGAISDKITDVGDGHKGLPLGVEPSQIEMIALPSALDSYMNCQVGVVTGHYMDDYHILVPPDKDPHYILDKFVNKASEYGIIVNRRKTKIVEFGKPFKFCKMKRYIATDGKVVKRGCPKSITRARRKIRKYARDRKQMRYEDVYMSVNSSIAYFRNFNNHNTELKLKRLFYSLFKFRCDDLTFVRKFDNLIEEERRYNRWNMFAIRGIRRSGLVENGVTLSEVLDLRLSGTISQTDQKESAPLLARMLSDISRGTTTDGVSKEAV